MIDPVSAAVVAVVFAAGWLVGRHGRLKAAPPKQPQPWCLCEHHYGAHDPASGECLAATLEQRWTSKHGYHDVSNDCPCARYTGPQPIEQYWAPPSADMSIVTAPLPIANSRRPND